MNLSFGNLSATLHYGIHVLDGLKSLPSNSVQCIVTSPPYWGLRNYKTEPVLWPSLASAGESEGGSWLGELGQEPTPELYIEHLVMVFRECKRILRNDGTLWLNLGDSYCGSNSAGIEDNKAAGKGSQQTTVSERPNKSIEGLKPKDLVGIPWMAAFALRKDGWYLRAENIWHKPNPMPESVQDRTTRAHEHIFLLSKSRDYYYDNDAVKLLAKDPEDDLRRMSQASASDKRNQGDPNVARLRGDKQRGHSRRHDGFNDRWDGMSKDEQQQLGANLRSVWTIATQPYAEAHFATFPPAIPTICIKAGTSEKGCCSKCGKPWLRTINIVGHTVTEEMKVAGCDSDGNYSGQAVKDYDRTGAQNPSDTKRRILEKMSQVVEHDWQPDCTCKAEVVPCIVLDPFSGSGTTGGVALSLHRNYIGIDVNPDYLPLAVRRIKKIFARAERTMALL